MALSRKYRLRAATELDRVRQQGKAVRTGLFFVKYLKNTVGYKRIGVSVPVRSFKFAHQRNRIRRIILNSMDFKNSQPPTLDLVITPNQLILERPRQEIKSELEKTITKIFVNEK